jgi:flagellar biosynthesis/type III secretory pathway protein FliH
MERTFVSLFEEEGLKRGLERGLAQGLAQGREQGLSQGLAQGQQRTVLRQLRRRFGDVPPEAEERLREITDPAALDDLADRLLTAASLEELGLSRDGHQAGFPGP